MKVKVLAKDGQELMPTTIEKANKLIAKGEAELLEESPMTIRMLKNTKRYKQESMIPDIAHLESKNDLFWNGIPLGLAINSATQDVMPIGWYLNNQNKDDRWLETVPSSSILISGGVGSGKSIVEQNMIAHVSKFNKQFQLVGVDLKRVEFNLIKGVKGVRGVAFDINSTAEALSTFHQIMMNRFKIMEQNRVNDILKVENAVVNYYKVFGKLYQFDEIFELEADIDKNDSNYIKLQTQYPDGRQSHIMTIEAIYESLENNKFNNPSLPQVKGFNKYISIGDIEKISGVYIPKALIFLVDEMYDLMLSDDYKSVYTIKQIMGSIARLGRAASVHLVLAARRPSGAVISSDLMNNIQQTILLGEFEPSTSVLLFDKDISDKAKPEIKGRGFTQIGKRDIYETQIYWVEPENSWEFDEEQKLTYNNPIYLTQCKNKNKEPNMTGFVASKKNEEYIEVNSLEDIRYALNNNLQEIIMGLNRLSENINTVLDNIE